MTQTAERPVIALPTVAVVASRHPTLDHATLLTGLTMRAMEGKIARGVWVEGRHYYRRDGRIHLDMEAYEQWVRTGK